MAFKACKFAAVSTCGQRLTTLRRLVTHEKNFDELVSKLAKAYSNKNWRSSLIRNSWWIA